jgi:hypothetical protein
MYVDRDMLPFSDWGGVGQKKTFITERGKREKERERERRSRPLGVNIHIK